MELTNLRRVGGCAHRIVNVLGILFEEVQEEDVIPLRLRTTCKKKWSAECNIFDCRRYRIGTVGSHRISWDRAGARA